MQKKFTKVSQTLRKFSMKILSPFGPKLAKIKVPKSILDKINLEVDKIIKNKSRVKKNDYSKRVVGQVYQEIELPKKPDSKVEVADTFNIDSKITVKAFKEKNAWVPEIDNSYVFDKDTTLSILAGFEHNRRVMIQGFHGTG